MKQGIVEKRRRLAVRKKRVRGVVAGTAERPRLCIVRTVRHLYAQVIDDAAGTTLVAASTLSPEVAKDAARTWNRQAAQAVGRLIAEKAKAKGITRVVFDRRGCKYHGRLKALADAAREAGLAF